MNNLAYICAFLTGLLVAVCAVRFWPTKVGASAIVLVAISTVQKEAQMNLALTLTDSQQSTGTFAVNDKKGLVDPAATVAWTVDDATVASIAPSTDGKTITVTAQKPGQTAAHAVAGALTLDVAITVTASADTAIQGSFADPTEQTPPATPTA